MTYVVVDKEQLEADLGIVCDAIREKGGTSELLAFPNGMADAVRAIQSGGGVNWLDYSGSLDSFFYKFIFDKEDVVISFGNKRSNVIENTNLLYETFYEAYGMKKIEIKTNAAFKSGQSASRAFYISSNGKYDELEEIDLIGINHVVIRDAFQMFYGRKFLKRILGVLDFTECKTSSALSNPFSSCNMLEEIRVKEQTIKASIYFSDSSLLSAESIQSIIDGLADLTGGTAQTIRFHADVKAKLTDEQKTQITSKNWILA